MNEHQYKVALELTKLQFDKNRSIDLIETYCKTYTEILNAEEKWKEDFRRNSKP